MAKRTSPALPKIAKPQVRDRYDVGECDRSVYRFPGGSSIPSQAVLLDRRSRDHFELQRVTSSGALTRKASEKKSWELKRKVEELEEKNREVIEKKERYKCALKSAILNEEALQRSLAVNERYKEEQQKEIGRLEVELEKSRFQEKQQERIQKLEEKIGKMEAQLQKVKSDSPCPKESCIAQKGELIVIKDANEKLQTDLRQVHEKLNKSEVALSEEREKCRKASDEQGSIRVLLQSKESELAAQTSLFENMKRLIQDEMEKVKRTTKSFYEDTEKKINRSLQDGIQQLEKSAMLTKEDVGRIHSQMSLEYERNQELERVTKEMQLAHATVEGYQAQVVCLNKEIKSMKKNLSKKENELAKKSAECHTLTHQINALYQQHHEDQKLNEGRCKRRAEECEKHRIMLSSPTCSRPDCARLLQQIQEQKANLQKLTPMKSMEQQYGSRHDQLSREYDELMTNPDGILCQLEKAFDDPFDAKYVLTGLFMDAYAESRDCVTEILCQNIQKLYTVQPDESKRAEMESLSSAFGVLLHCAGVKSQLSSSPVLSRLREKIKEKLPDLDPNGKAKMKLEDIIDLPLKKVVEIAWKFVTEPNPVIVCRPEKYDSELHSKDFVRWNKLKGNFRLLYAKPVVYRSYHGLIMSKGLVGSTKDQPVETEL